MGKCGPKPSFVDIPCLNKDCEIMGKSKNENVVSNGTFCDEETISDFEISTSHIERENLNLRQENKRLARKTLAFSKEDEWLQFHLTLQVADHNFVRTHWSLQKPNLKRIKGNVWKKYDKITPMMSIGLTDHI